MSGTAHSVMLMGLVGASLAFSVLLAVLFWMHARAIEKSLVRRERAARTEVDALRNALAQLAKDVDELMLPAEEAHAAPVAPRAGLNLTRRSQALRMNRRGDSSEQIAAALGVPKQEIDLLLKVHRILVSTV